MDVTSRVIGEMGRLVLACHEKDAAIETLNEMIAELRTTIGTLEGKLKLIESPAPTNPET